MVNTTIPNAGVWTAADLVTQFGAIPLHRVRLQPSPGEATEQDVLTADSSRPLGDHSPFLRAALRSELIAAEMLGTIKSLIGTLEEHLGRVAFTNGGHSMLNESETCSSRKVTQRLPRQSGCGSFRPAEGRQADRYGATGWRIRPP